MTIKQRTRLALTAACCALAGVVSVILTRALWEPAGPDMAVTAVVVIAGGIGVTIEWLRLLLQDDNDPR
jgi:hypothetical protein